MFVTWVSAWLKCIKRNSNFTQTIMISLKGPSTFKSWLTCPFRASMMVRSRRETLVTYHCECLYGECIAPNSDSARILINVWGCISKNGKLDLTPTKVYLHRKILMKSSGLMLNHTLTTMRWQIVINSGWDKHLYNKDKSGRSCQCNRPPVVSREPRY